MNKKINILICTLLLSLFVLTGCAKSLNNTEKESYTDYYYGSSFVPNSNIQNYASDSETGKKDVDKQDISKIIVTASVSMEANELDDTLNSIKDCINKYNGYIQYSSVSNRYKGNRRYCEMTVRIPANNFEEFFAATKLVGNVIDSSIKTDDITQQYYDTQSRLDSLRLQEERVKEFYKQAKTISELLEIEHRLSEIQSEIAAKEVTMQNYELLTSYSTVTFIITEVEKYTPVKQSFFSELWDVMKDSFNSFLVFLTDVLFFFIYGFWYIVLAVAAYFLIKFLNKKYHFLNFKRKNKKKENKEIEEQNKE